MNWFQNVLPFSVQNNYSNALVTECNDNRFYVTGSEMQNKN